MTLSPIDPHARRCLDCDYLLQGLTESRCPECGRRFDPWDPVTTSSARRLPRRMVCLLQPPGWPLHVAVSLVFTLSLLAFTGPAPYWLLLAMAFLGWMAVGGIWAA